MTTLDDWTTIAGIATVAAVWLAAMATLSPTVRGKNSMLPAGVFFWAVGCSLQAPWLYRIVDGALGGVNVTNLLYRSGVIVALACLEVMVIRAMRGMKVPGLEALVWFGAAVAIGVQTAAFVSADWAISDPYLGRYTGEPVREVFASVLPICVGLYGVQVSRVAWRGLQGYGEWTTRWGVSLIGVAAVLDIVCVIETLVVAAVRVGGDPRFLMIGTTDPLWELAVVSMAVVTAIGVVIAAARPLVIRPWRRILLVACIPVSNRALRDNPEYSVHSIDARRHAAFGGDTDDAELALWQRWSELEDGMRLRKFRPRWYESRLIQMMETATSAGIAASIMPELGLLTQPREPRKEPAL